MSPTGQHMLGCSHQRKLNYLLYDDTKVLREALRYEQAYESIVRNIPYVVHCIDRMFYRLMMLCLYLYSLIISHKSCNMLSILNPLTLQKKLQHCVTCVLVQKSKNTTTRKIKHKNPCRPWVLNLEPLALKANAVTTPPSQLRVSILGKLFKGKHKETKLNLRATHFQQFHFFCIIIHAWITI